MEREYNKIIIKYAYLRLGKIIFLLLNNLKTQFVESIVQKGHIQTINITKKKKKNIWKNNKTFFPIIFKRVSYQISFQQKKEKKIVFGEWFSKILFMNTIREKNEIVKYLGVG